MKNNSIIIIGNGESILKNKFGKKINLFKDIIRINNFITKGYEPFIGSKTTIWFNGANQGLFTRNQFPKKIIVSLPSEVYKKKKNIDSHITKRINNNAFLKIPLKKIFEYENKVGHKRLSTGMYAIMWALDNYNDIYIHGFDFFLESKGHYFDNKVIKFIKNNSIIKKGQKHNAQLEKKYVQFLINEKRIKALL